MKIIIRNLITTLKRFKTPVILNILGLSVAFASFVIIMMQVIYEYGYNKSFPKSDRICRIAVTMNGEKYGLFNQSNMDDIKSVSSHIESITCVGTFTYTEKYFKVKRADGSEHIFEADMVEVAPDFKDMFDLEYVEGDAKALENPKTLIIPQSMARKFFGNESPIGKLVGDFPVGAVYRDLPKNVSISNSIYFSLPKEAFMKRGFNHHILLTLDSPKNLETVRKLINDNITKLYEDDFYKGMTMDLQPIEDIYFDTTVKWDLGDKGNRSNTNIFLTVAILVILIASINYVNFASALTPVRIKMINMQKILGGNQAMIRCSLMFESLAIVIVSFLVGLFIVEALTNTQMASHFDAPMSFAANALPIQISAIVALLVGVLAGIYPMLYMTSFPPILALKGSFGMSPRGRRLRSMLIGIQYVISIVLIISMLLINQQNKYISNFSLGFDRNNIIKTVIPTTMSHSELKNKMKAKANIEDVAYSMFEFGATETYGINGFEKDGKTVKFQSCIVSEDFLNIMKITIAEGRNFPKLDQESTDNIIIFNQVAKKEGNLQLNEKVYGGEVIGFTAEGLRTNSIRSADVPFAFILNNSYNFPFPLQHTYIRIKEGCNVSDAIETIKSVFHEVEPAFTPTIEFMDDVTNKLYQKELRANYLITAFSILAVIISLIGVFGLVMFETQYRRKEIGVRRVFGASITGILQLFNLKFVRIVLVCFVIAVPIAYYIINGWLANFKFHINIAWWVFALALIIVLVITVATVTIRSYNTATENPSQSIKTE